MTRIALLGAESTGKTQLARELADHFDACGLRAAVAGEVLLEWCVRECRAPRPEEQLAIAQEQERRVDEAAAKADVVIADTTAVMVLVYSGMLFPDHALYRFALERQSRYDATLVTGLDVPWVADGLHRDGTHSREHVDELLRELLSKAGVDYRVVYGTGKQRCANALAALAGTAGLAESAGLPRRIGSPAERPWVWSCDKCSDPECEHRLFARLLGR